MKKNFFKHVLLLLLAISLCVSFLSACQEQQGNQQNEPEGKLDYVQLLGFESYDEITGTKLVMGNFLGKMGVNTDPAYITQGEGSLMVQPQGNYGHKRAHPFLKLDFLNTTCATCDFSSFKSVSFDVYNASAEDVQINVCVNVGKEDGNYIATIKETYTLKANSWTTCTYDLSVMAGFSVYDFTSVRYLTIEFLDHKQSKDDAVDTVYIDNLVGNLFAEGEEPTPISFDFYDGIDFETPGHELMFTGQGKDQDATIDRLAYSSLDISAPEEGGGEYVLRLTSDDHYWPTFRINFGETLKAGTIVSFDVLSRDVTNDEVVTVTIFEYDSGVEATDQQYYGDWNRVSLKLPADSAYVDLICTMDRWSQTASSADVEVYIDNMVASDPEPPIEPEGNFWDGIGFEVIGNMPFFTEPEDRNQAYRFAILDRMTYAEAGVSAPNAGSGEYVLRITSESNYWPVFRLDFGETLPAGTIISFDAYSHDITDDSVVTVSIFEYMLGGEATEQYYYGEWTAVKFKLQQDCSYVDLCCTLDRWEKATGVPNIEVFVDNFKATPGVPPIKPVGNFLEGLDFEIKGNVGYFVGQGDEKTDAVIEWVSYDRVNIPIPENGGTHLMKISHDSFYWPAFRVNFGRTLPAGTKISFMAYGTIKGETQYEQSIFEFSHGLGEATSQFKCDQWTQLTITLPVATSFGDLFWNFDRAGIISKSASGAVYIDNVIAILPVEAEGDIYEGLAFEIPGNAAFFTGLGDPVTDATIQRVAYEDLAIPALPSGGEYALSIGHDSYYWPAFRVNFGQTLVAGTKINFMAYAVIDGETLYDQSIFEFKFTIDGQVYTMEATSQFKCGQWTPLSIVVPVDTTFGDLFWNFDRAGITSETASGVVYLDNVVAVPPVTISGDINEGLGFEEPGNELYFVEPDSEADSYRYAIFNRVSYASAGISAPANGGEYALKLTHTTNYWPVFRIEFGQTLPAGTTISFDAYSRDLTNDSVVTVSIFEYISGGEATIQYYYGSWNNLSFTLAEDCSYIDLVCTMDRWEQTTDVTNVEVYLDNFKATQPGNEPVPTGDILEGYGFETEGNELFFTAVGGDNQWRDATLTVVDYANENLAAPANGGSHALKLTCANSQWPVFKLNFGQTLPAGTVVTFDAYSRDITDAEKVTVSIFEYVSGGEATAQYYFNSWNALSITLASDCDSIELVCAMDRWNESTASNYEVYMDNFKATVPAEVVEPVGDITEGIGFEVEGNELFYTGIGYDQDATVERAAYADLGITAADNGSTHVLKLSHASHYYPTFQLNFGKTLPAGTVITFNAYGTFDGWKSGNDMNIEFTGDSGSGQVVYMLPEMWFAAEITLTEDRDHLQFFYNIERNNGVSGAVASSLYIDNVKAEEPDDTFANGLGFENDTDAGYFTGVGNGNEWRDATLTKVSYADAGITAAENGGDYALKLTCTSSYWPTVRINFGKTLPAGTVVTFDAYTRDITTTEITTVTIFEYVSGGEAATQYYYNTWNQQSFTLSQATDHIDLVCTLDRWEKTSDCTNVEVYLDNFKAVVPA